MKKTLICMVCCLLLCSCALSRQPSVVHTAPARDSSGRQAGPAMDFYEQAEKDLDVNSVIVIPPPLPATKNAGNK